MNGKSYLGLDILSHISKEATRTWLAEIERRARAAIAGEPGLSWEEVRAEVERNLADN